MNASSVPATGDPDHTTRGDDSVNADQVHRVAVRIPPFWPSDPGLWFLQLEQQFSVAGIVRDGTKFSYAVGNLEPRYAAEVKDVIVAPPPTDQYGTLKRELIARLTPSSSQRAKQVLHREELGDQKPSQFLRRLRDLGQGLVPDELLRTVWLERLPGNLPAAMATRNDLPLDELARLADGVAEFARPQSVDAVAPPTSPDAVAPPTTADAGLAAAVAQMTREFRNMRQELAELRRPNTSRRRFRSPSPRRRRSVSQDADDTRCWFHRTFGSRARRCRAPCYMASGNEKGGRQ